MLERDQKTSWSYYNWNLDERLLYDYGCSFVAKLSWKIFEFFTEYTLFAEKNIFILKKAFFTEKNIYENVKNIYLIWEKLFYKENVCDTNKIQIFLKFVFILQKKFFWS